MNSKIPVFGSPFINDLEPIDDKLKKRGIIKKQLCDFGPEVSQPWRRTSTAKDMLRNPSLTSSLNNKSNEEQKFVHTELRILKMEKKVDDLLDKLEADRLKQKNEENKGQPEKSKKGKKMTKNKKQIGKIGVFRPESLPREFLKLSSIVGVVEDDVKVKKCKMGDRTGLVRGFIMINGQWTTLRKVYKEAYLKDDEETEDEEEVKGKEETKIEETKEEEGEENEDDENKDVKWKSAFKQANYKVFMKKLSIAPQLIEEEKKKEEEAKKSANPILAKLKASKSENENVPDNPTEKKSLKSDKKSSRVSESQKAKKKKNPFTDVK